MINKFTIQDTELCVDTTIQDSIAIKSHPQDYNVVFRKFTNSFKDNEVVLVDKNVQQLYNIQHSKMLVVEAIEENKCIETVLDICESLMNLNFDKGSTLIVIGGGIIQDIGAYTAKTFRRGVNWVFYPTTLLSQCDSCIGGKTALNFKKYKNQLALFSAPTEVVIDLNFLETLSDKDIASGHGEIVKLFLTGGQYYVERFSDFTMLEKIYHSLSIKKAVVECDEFEKSERKSLNYGHSFGHVIETLTNYKIPHGEAVMLGIEVINRIFTKSPMISNMISKYTTLDRIKDIDVPKLVAGLKTDKKVASGYISFVVVPQPGTTIFVHNTIDQNLETLVYEVFAN
jgi:3-dehydroquinate synthase